MHTRPPSSSEGFPLTRDPRACAQIPTSPRKRGVTSHAAPAVELRHIDKRFGAVHANRDVSLNIVAGSITGIVGENGAGKSTLMSILYGFYQADSGEILIDSKSVVIARPADAIALGIGMVHQHFVLVDTFTVLENIMLGAEGGGRLRRGAGSRERWG